MSNHKMTMEPYLPVVRGFCHRHGLTWALPLTPGSLALHWNKELFRKAGLNPEIPPKTLEELERMAEKLTIVELVRSGKRIKLPFSELTAEEKKSRDFHILQLGYAPNIPGWYDALWSFWHGGTLSKTDGDISANTPENQAALRWYRSYAEKYGLQNLQRFTAGSGSFASPQNPFLAGKVAMEIQGVWMYNFLDKFAPSMPWGAAPFPSAAPLRNVTLVESDVIVIPRGAKHPREAFEFLAYLQRPENLEKLNLGQRKFPPLRKISEEFLRRHPNPNIRVFIDLAASPNAKSVPSIPIWNEYKSELLVAYEQVFSGKLTPEEALAEVQKRIGWKQERIRMRWDLVKETRLKEWSAENDRF
jgi:ABC-type sugar transport system, periplasmic component